MSAPEPSLLPREPAEGAPVFTVPWHAEALGIANVLIEGGMFSANEWAEALGEEIRRRTGEPDTDENYYRAVLTALERLVGEKSPATGGSLAERVEAWRRAYLNTPHGKPVTLDAANGPAVHHDHDGDHDHHDHHHHHHRADCTALGAFATAKLRVDRPAPKFVRLLAAHGLRLFWRGPGNILRATESWSSKTTAATACHRSFIPHSAVRP